MSDTYNDLGGQPSDAPLPVKKRRQKPRHAGECNHPDGHHCPWGNEVLDARGYVYVQQCDCEEG